MIRYALACQAGHDFVSWFRSSDDYETQEARGLVSCPVCGSLKVERQIMAPQVARKDRDAAQGNRHGAGGEGEPVALIDPQAQAMRQKIAELRAQLMQSSEDVGGKFAEEARKIHYGESEQRSIHGRASRDEAEALADEGIGFLPLPVLPDERN